LTDLCVTSIQLWIGETCGFLNIVKGKKRKKTKGTSMRIEQNILRYM